jgi:SAM-dependent methyltransferase
MLSFDTPEAREYVAVRQAIIAEVVREIRGQFEMKSALDVGCGVGYFAKGLANLNFSVVAIDGRSENVLEAQQRYPDLNFSVANAEELQDASSGIYDFVLCVGLLYHLENPFRAIRGLFTVTGKVLFVESMCVPGGEPALELLDEGHGENQGLNYVAFYPTESCLVKMLYSSGFPYVYGLRHRPAHHSFHDTRDSKRQRTVLVASREPLSSRSLALLPKPHRAANVWAISRSASRSRAQDLKASVCRVASSLLGFKARPPEGLH